MLDLYYIFFPKILTPSKKWKLIHTRSILLWLMIRLNIAWNRTWEKFGTTSEGLTVAILLLQIPATIFFARICCFKHIKHDKREPGLFKEEFGCSEMICLCSKTYCCFDQGTNKIKLSSKGLNQRTLEESGARPPEKYRCVLDKKTNVQSTNWGFRTIQHSVCTYEQTKRGLPYFYPIKIVLDDGIHLRTLFSCNWSESIIIIPFSYFPNISFHSTFSHST